MKTILLILVLSVPAMAQQLSPNQAIVEADKNYPATVFNKAVIIEVVEVREGSVTAVVRCKGANNLLNAKAGYETTCKQFKVRIVEVKQDSAVFFVERGEVQDAVTYLIYKGRALEIYRGSDLGAPDLELFVEGANTTGKVALTLKSKEREAILDSIEMTGIVKPRRVVVVDCNAGVSRGEDCTVRGKARP